MPTDLSRYVHTITRSAAVTALIDEELEPKVAAIAHRMVETLTAAPDDPGRYSHEIYSLLAEIDMAQSTLGRPLSPAMQAFVHIVELSTNPPEISFDDRRALLDDCLVKLPSDSLLRTIVVDFAETAANDLITDQDSFVAEISRVRAECHQPPPCFDLPPRFSTLPRLRLQFRAWLPTDTSPSPALLSVNADASQPNVWEVTDGRFLLGEANPSLRECTFIAEITADDGHLTGAEILWKIHLLLKNFDCGFHTLFERLVFLGEDETVPLFFLSCCATFDPTEEPFADQFPPL